MLSRNSFLISTSQKARVRVSFERAHDDQTTAHPSATDYFKPGFLGPGQAVNREIVAGLTL
jgi:hypothetical protein